MEPELPTPEPQRTEQPLPQTDIVEKKPEESVSSTGGNRIGLLLLGIFVIGLLAGGVALQVWQTAKPTQSRSVAEMDQKGNGEQEVAAVNGKTPAGSRLPDRVQNANRNGSTAVPPADPENLNSNFWTLPKLENSFTGNTNGNGNGSGATALDLDEVPPAPKGFRWYFCENMGGQFLRPLGWYTLEEIKDTTEACYITKERIKDGGVYKTGLSIQRLNNMKQTSQVEASVYAQAFMKAMTENTGEVELVGQVNTIGTGNPFKGYGATFKSVTSDIEMYMLVMAQDAEDRMYLLNFESPTQDWEKSWKLGKTMMEYLGFSAD